MTFPIDNLLKYQTDYDSFRYLILIYLQILLTSGAMYSTVPQKLYVFDPSNGCFDRPKSVKAMCPSCEM